MDDRLTQSDASVAAFVAAHPGYEVDPAQPAYRGGTNCVTFGRFGPRPIVYKHFRYPPRWANELFCLRHFASTGHVPRVLAVEPDHLIVMARLPSGTDLRQPQAPPALASVSQQIGQALADLSAVPLPIPGPGYCPTRDFRIILWGDTPQQALAAYLPLCRAAAESVPPCRTAFFRRSLSLLESHLDLIPSHRPVLFQEDLGNLAVDQGRFQGFFDFEMCRLGTEPMQLAMAMGMCANGLLSWPDLLAAYEACARRRLTREDRVAILAMHHFYHWIRICRWGWWDGNPVDAEALSAATAYAENRRDEMQAACRLIDPALP